ncbi:hypothetical protein [Antrihabitans sp. YC2-6]|nr:hypothetical protein [Antrihabitans sp. YC2-6]MBJ8348299.1 hypothetical protein [Antrihabitans sp. YC2-6]
MSTVWVVRSGLLGHAKRAVRDVTRAAAEAARAAGELGRQPSEAQAR